jgi:hypothetical protein
MPIFVSFRLISELNWTDGRRTTSYIAMSGHFVRQPWKRCFRACFITVIRLQRYWFQKWVLIMHLCRLAGESSTFLLCQENAVLHLYTCPSTNFLHNIGVIGKLTPLGNLLPSLVENIIKSRFSWQNKYKIIKKWTFSKNIKMKNNPLWLLYVWNKLCSQFILQISRLFEVADRFFKLPSEEKEQFATEFSPTNFHGWMSAGREMWVYSFLNRVDKQAETCCIYTDLEI